ncbi:putative: similar to TPR repeat-containing protein, partial [Candida maltosa Xu316]
PGQGFGRNDDDDRPSGGFYTEQSSTRSDRPSSGSGLGGQQFSGPGGFDSNRPTSSGYGGSGTDDERRNQGSTKYGTGRQFDRD